MLYLNAPDVLSFSFHIPVFLTQFSRMHVSLSRSFFSAIVIEGDDIFQNGAFVTDTVIRYTVLPLQAVVRAPVVYIVTTSLRNHHHYYHFNIQSLMCLLRSIIILGGE